MEVDKKWNSLRRWMCAEKGVLLADSNDNRSWLGQCWMLENSHRRGKLSASLSHRWGYTGRFSGYPKHSAEYRVVLDCSTTNIDRSSAPISFVFLEKTKRPGVGDITSCQWGCQLDCFALTFLGCKLNLFLFKMK